MPCRKLIWCGALGVPTTLQRTPSQCSASVAKDRRPTAQALSGARADTASNRSIDGSGFGVRSTVQAVPSKDSMSACMELAVNVNPTVHARPSGSTATSLKPLEPFGLGVIVVHHRILGSVGRIRVWSAFATAAGAGPTHARHSASVIDAEAKTLARRRRFILASPFPVTWIGSRTDADRHLR